MSVHDDDTVVMDDRTAELPVLVLPGGDPLGGPGAHIRPATPPVGQARRRRPQRRRRATLAVLAIALWAAGLPLAIRLGVAAGEAYTTGHPSLGRTLAALAGLTLGVLAAERYTAWRYPR